MNFGETCISPIMGYIILGHRNGRYFHLYGDTDTNTLFANDDFTGEIHTKDCPFIIFAKEEDATRDALDLKKCCHNDDYNLEYIIAKCVINIDADLVHKEFLGYDTYCANLVEVEELKKVA